MKIDSIEKTDLNNRDKKKTHYRNLLYNRKEI